MPLNTMAFLIKDIHALPIHYLYGFILITNTQQKLQQTLTQNLLEHKMSLPLAISPIDVYN
jgi:hypothetical protein